MTHQQTLVAVATVLAVVLRSLIGQLRRSPELWGRLRPWAPLILVGLGALVAGACFLSGMPVDDAMILAAGAPGAVVVEELAATPQRQRARDGVPSVIVDEQEGQP